MTFSIFSHFPITHSRLSSRATRSARGGVENSFRHAWLTGRRKFPNRFPLYGGGGGGCSQPGTLYNDGTSRNTIHEGKRKKNRKESCRQTCPRCSKARALDDRTLRMKGKGTVKRNMIMSTERTQARSKALRSTARAELLNVITLRNGLSLLFPHNTHIHSLTHSSILPAHFFFLRLVMCVALSPTCKELIFQRTAPAQSRDTGLDRGARELPTRFATIWFWRAFFDARLSLTIDYICCPGDAVGFVQQKTPLSRYLLKKKFSWLKNLKEKNPWREFAGKLTD